MKKISLGYLKANHAILSPKEKKQIVGGYSWPSGLYWDGSTCYCDWGYQGDPNHVEEEPCDDYYCAREWPDKGIIF